MENRKVVVELELDCSIPVSKLRKTEVVGFYFPDKTVLFQKKDGTLVQVKVIKPK